VGLPRLLVDQRTSGFVEASQFPVGLGMSPVRIDNGLTRLLSAVSVHESFQTESDGIGPSSCDSFTD
jgi:hypothetical protein